ncbi:hypothetical protein [Serratia microhaemolytica]|uniref:COG4648 family protein n=1 Tax=Serratia microhaemolytica TaxID=2675110 RepID=UPI000FDD996C|nr:hypothetical protein [Serratia microhaemolytica]
MSGSVTALNIIKLVSGVVTGALVLTWPLLVWLGLRYNALNWLLPLMMLLLLLRCWLLRQNRGPMRLMMQSVALIGMVLCSASAWLGSHQLLLYYPVVVNLVMLTLFAGSLFSAMPIVERLARLREPELPPEGVRYTRRVTQVWCLFFMVNATIAFSTAWYGDVQLWTAWNGMIAYLLIGLLMAGEWSVRRRMIKRKVS